MVRPELASLVEANAWTFGPVATALRVLEIGLAQKAGLPAFFEPLLAQCPRMAPLGYWLSGLAAGAWPAEQVAADYLRREALLAGHLSARLGPARAVLLVGHDRELDALWAMEPGGRTYRYLLLDGPPGADAPGSHAHRRKRRKGPSFEEPFPFSQVEDALDWADAVVLSGFVMHRQNLLGPPQLRPLLATARDQADQVLLCMVNERRLALGEGAPRRYVEDFRPYLWQSSVTHIISEWQTGAEGTSLGWLPLPVEVLTGSLGEELVEK